ncbi:MAG: hypothetical protein ACTSYC_06835 [Promethearchaeota archaeon]
MRIYDIFSLEEKNTNNLDKAIQNYNLIKECLKGIHDIIDITLSEENPFSNLVMDNLLVLHNSVLDLIENDEGVKQLKKKIQNKEIKVNRTINFFHEK